MASSVATEITLVFGLRQPLVREIPAVCQVLVTGGGMGIWCPSPRAPSASTSVHRCVEDWLGCASARLNISGDMNRGRIQSPFQHL